MELWMLPKEALLSTFKLANGSAWLTNHRLILCKHESGHLEDTKPNIYYLKNLKKAQINDSTLTLHFKGEKAKSNSQ